MPRRSRLPNGARDPAGSGARCQCGWSVEPLWQEKPLSGCTGGASRPGTWFALGGPSDFERSSTPMVWNAFGNGMSWDPWRELAELHRHFDQYFWNGTLASAGEFPPIELWSREEGIRLLA